MQKANLAGVQSQEAQLGLSICDRVLASHSPCSDLRNLQGVDLREACCESASFANATLCPS